MYYRAKQVELSAEIADIEKYLNSVNKNLIEDLCNQSMVVLKDKLARKYKGNSSRKTFSEDNLWKEPYDVMAEYPVILSTTFSSRNSLNSDVVYDYLIMDEASQVDIATGALALSCARNVVIVGDTKQLPNVVTDDIKAKAKAIFDSFNVSEGYQYTNSFLQSILDVMPNVTQTLLREHYRCHPKIINFCNQKFYRGELIIMTTDKGEEDVLSVVKTVAGNHERKAAYYPQCNNLWTSGCHRKLKDGINCKDCKSCSYKTITKFIILNHLQGNSYNATDVIGIYPLFSNGTCRFIVFDFDNHDKGAEERDFANTDDTWIEEVEAMREICVLNGIDPLVERSRSGKGVHIWIFFDKPIAASLVRKFGFTLQIQRRNASNTLVIQDIKNDLLTGLSKDINTLHQYIYSGEQDTLYLREVVRCIRPCIEGIFRLKYFNLVKDNQWLGDFISMIRDSDISSPLYRLKDYLPEIEELNEYSKIYHHSNPNYLDVLINPTELSIHVRSTINLLYVL